MRSTKAATQAKLNNRNPEYRKSLRLQRIHNAIALYQMEPRSLSDRLLPNDMNSSAYEEVLVDNVTEPADHRMMRLEQTERISRAMRENLSPREERILRLRFGFDDELTLDQIGQKGYMDLSRERIRQVEFKALGKLRRALRHA